VITECYPRPHALQHCVFAHRQLVGLQSADWRVHVLIPGPSYPRWAWPLAGRWRNARRQALPDGWSHEGVAVRTLAYPNPIPNRLSGAANLGELVERTLHRELLTTPPDESPSVLICQFALPLGPIVRRVAQEHGRPYVVVLRGDDVWIWPHARRDGVADFTATVRDATLVVAVSETMLTEARRLSGLALSRAVVLPNGVDLERFHPASQETRQRVRSALGIPDAAFVVLCVAAAIARKGWRELFDAVGAMNDSRVVVLAASLGPGDLDLEVEHQRRCPASRLVLRQSLPAHELADLYAAADVFCLPTHGEGMSNALLEAMAAGKAVITTSVGGHPEVITPELDGFLVPPRLVPPLTEMLTMFRDDATLCEDMGAAARKRVENVGTPADNGRRLAELLNRVADGTLPETVSLPNPYHALSRAVA
jgi:glycosyltransferase involved in cell wall biosynthesis